MDIKRGNIYFANLGEGIGSEQFGIRPVVVVQNDIGNKNSPTIIIAPMTSQVKRCRMPTHAMIVPDETNGLRKKVSPCVNKSAL
jgi:mRNA interferase MazF